MPNYKNVEGVKICGLHDQPYNKYYDECEKCRENRNLSVPITVDVYVKTPFPHIKQKQKLITGE